MCSGEISVGNKFDVVPIQPIKSCRLLGVFFSFCRVPMRIAVICGRALRCRVMPSCDLLYMRRAFVSRKSNRYVLERTLFYLLFSRKICHVFLFSFKRTEITFMSPVIFSKFLKLIWNKKTVAIFCVSS